MKPYYSYTCTYQPDYSDYLTVNPDFQFAYTMFHEMQEVGFILQGNGGSEEQHDEIMDFDEMFEQWLELTKDPRCRE